jgi:hypothetical protein
MLSRNDGSIKERDKLTSLALAVSKVSSLAFGSVLADLSSSDGVRLLREGRVVQPSRGVVRRVLLYKGDGCK